MTGEDFLTVSNRGRMALFLCCAEQALSFENPGLLHPRWPLLLTKFWNVLGWNDLEEIHHWLSEYIPKGFAMNSNTFEQYSIDIQEDLPVYLIEEDEFDELQIIYNSGSMACTFLNSMKQYFTDGIYGAEDEAYSVRLINRYLAYIETNNLSLPPLENFQACVRTGPFNWGDPITREMIFNGPTV